MNVCLLFLAFLAAGVRAAAAPVEIVPRLTLGWAPAAPGLGAVAAPLTLTGAGRLSALSFAPSAPALPVSPVTALVEAPALLVPEIAPTVPNARKKTDDVGGPADSPDASNYSAKFDGSVARDGSDGKSYVASPPVILKTVGGDLELRRFQSSEGPSIQVSRRLFGGRYEVRERRAGETKGFDFSFRLEKGGVLKAGDQSDAAPVLVDAAAEFARAFRTFGSGVRAVEGRRAEEEGFSPEEATARTWLGRQAAAAGFTRVIFLKDPSKALFVRPEDVLTDAAGGAWRRTKVKSDKLGVWTRYEKDGRVVWHAVRVFDNSFMIAEHAGAEIPPPGTPAQGLAVYSVEGGRLMSHVDVERAALLDGVDARKKAAAYFGVAP